MMLVSSRRPPATNSPRGFITTRFVVPASVAAWMRDLVADVPRDLQRFFFHVLACGGALAYDDFWVPVSWELRRKELPEASRMDAYELLVEAGLFDTPTSYSKSLGRSRCYRASEAVRAAYEARRFAALMEREVQFVDVITGKTPRRLRTRTTDTNGNLVGRAGSPLRLALPVYSEAWLLIDWEAMLSLLAERRALMHVARDALDHSIGAARAPARKAYLAARGVYYNDLHCLTGIAAQKPAPAFEVAEGFYRVRLPYRHQKSGRVHVAGGGLQSSSRQMKRVACERLPGVRNYDLKASQVRGLIQRFEEAEADGFFFSTDWLRDYDATPDAKYVYAQRAGLTVDAWKRLLCATLMGCCHPRTLPPATEAERTGKQRDEGAAATARKILIEAGYADDLPGAYARVRAVLGDLIHERDRWHGYLTSHYVERHAVNTCSGHVIYNEAGASFPLDEDVRAMKQRDRADLGRRLSAFLLQGLEAAFIHTLATLGGDYGYEVLANEHDGLITIGEIPQAAIDRAADVSGLRYAELVEKPFTDTPMLETVSITNRDWCLWEDDADWGFLLGLAA